MKTLFILLSLFTASCFAYDYDTNSGVHIRSSGQQSDQTQTNCYRAFSGAIVCSNY